jgi:putative toxin-antitoxin system antitoxin component (TIGR02293 family)
LITAKRALEDRMDTELEFFDTKTKSKFKSSDWRVETSGADKGKVAYYAVAKAPRSGKEARRKLSAKDAEVHLIFDRDAAGTYPYAALVGIRASTLVALIDKVEEGLPYRALERLATLLGTSAVDLAQRLRIPARTLQRRKRSGVLSVEESERLLRLSRIFQASLDLFEGDRDASIAWLGRKNRGLAGQTPLEMSSTELGGEEVLNLIGRLEYGVFS